MRTITVYQAGSTSTPGDTKVYLTDDGEDEATDTTTGAVAGAHGLLDKVLGTSTRPGGGAAEACPG